jgi:hypothetical protein
VSTQEALESKKEQQFHKKQNKIYFHKHFEYSVKIIKNINCLMDLNCNPDTYIHKTYI